MSSEALHIQVFQSVLLFTTRGECGVHVQMWERTGPHAYNSYGPTFFDLHKQPGPAAPVLDVPPPPSVGKATDGALPRHVAASVVTSAVGGVVHCHRCG